MTDDGVLNRASLSAMKVAELREMCKERGLLVSGKKAELIDRLLGEIGETSAQESTIEAPTSGGELFLDDLEEEVKEAEIFEAEVVESSVTESAPTVAKRQPSAGKEGKSLDIDDAVDRLIAKVEGRGAVIEDDASVTIDDSAPPIADEPAQVSAPKVMEAEVLEAEIPVEPAPTPVAPKPSVESTISEDTSSFVDSLTLDEDDTWGAELSEPAAAPKAEPTVQTGKVKPRADDEASITITLPSLDIVKKYWQQLAAVAIVVLLVGAGVVYVLSAESSFKARPLNYGDSMQFTLSGGAINLDGDEMVALVRQALPNTAVQDACNELNIGMTGLGTISITKGDDSEIIHGLDGHLVGAISAKDAYGRNHLTAEQVLTHNLEVDLDGKTWRDTNICGNLGWSMSGNDLAMTTKAYLELTEEALLRSETDISFTDIDGQTSSATLVTFGADGFGNAGSMAPLLAFPLKPIELHDFFGDRELKDGAKSSSFDDWNSDWRWSVGKEYNHQKHGMVYPVELVHSEVERCLGHARIDILVQNGKPWPVEQVVDILIDKDRSTGDCGFFASAASDAALPAGSLTVKMTMSKTSTESGSTPVAWQATYAGRPGPGEDKPNSLTHKQWTTAMWDESETREFNLEEAMNCLRANHTNRQITTAIESDGYIWQAAYSQPTRSPEWNLSWVRSDDSAGWAIVRENANGCTVPSEGSYEAEEVTWNRDAIPETHTLKLLENRILDSNRYAGLAENLGTASAWNVDSEYGYRLSVSEENEFLSLLPGDLASGQVTVAGSRSWDEGNREYSASFAMNAETGRMLGWVIINGAAN